MTNFKIAGALEPDTDYKIIIPRREHATILGHIETKDLYVALCSPRQTGKTTLLFQLQKELREKSYGAAYIDISELEELSKKDFFKIVCEYIYHQLSDFIHCSSEGILLYNTVSNQVDFSKFLVQLSIHTPNARKLIIMLDEVDEVQEKISKAFFSGIRSFFHKGRRPSQERELCKKIMFIFSGSMGLQKLSQGKNSPLLNVCEPFSLVDFSREQVYSLADHLEADFSSEKLNIIGEKVYEWCNGQPYLTQCFYHLIDKSDSLESSIDQLPVELDNIVRSKIIFEKNSNLDHIIHGVMDRKGYKNSVYKVIKESELKSVQYDTELITLGVLKRLKNLQLAIRNNRDYQDLLESRVSGGLP